MDGLTISNADSLVKQGSTLSELRNARAAIPNPAATSQPGEKTFADTLQEAVQSVNQAQNVANFKMQELATGKSKDVADVMITAEKADISLKLMTSVRNKIIEAYQEIMKMQV